MIWGARQNKPAKPLHPDSSRDHAQTSLCRHRSPRFADGSLHQLPPINVHAAYLSAHAPHAFGTIGGRRRIVSRRRGRPRCIRDTMHEVCSKLHTFGPLCLRCIRPSRRRMLRRAACRPSGFRRLLPRRWLGHKCSSIKLNSTLHAVTSATLGRSAVGQPSACCCRKRPSGSPPAPRFVIGRPFGLCCRKWPPVPPLPSRLLCCRQSCFPRPCLGLSRCHARRNRVFQLFGRPCLSITAGLPASCSHCCRHQLGRNLFLAKRTIHRARFVEA